MKNIKQTLYLAAIAIPKGIVYLFVLPLVLVIRLVRPIVLVRFIPIRSRIGHAVGEVMVYLAEKRAGMHAGRAIDVYYPDKPIANHQLLAMWKRVVWVPPGARWVARLSAMLPWGKEHFEPSNTIGRHLRDVYGHSDHGPIPIDFTSEEKERGEKLLQDMGLKPNGFVCFYARDNAYLKLRAPDWEVAFNDYRDANIYNYLPAAQALVARGHRAIRMGNVVKDKLPDNLTGITDYPFTPWLSDFADLYLFYRCRFAIGSNTGLDFVPMLFQKPIVVVNYAPMAWPQVWLSRSIFVFKKYWSRREKRFLTFREVLGSDLAGATTAQEYAQKGIDVTENTSEEILDAALEMEGRLSGAWKDTPEMEELQRRFWSLYKPDENQKVFRARVGSQFLLKNRELLA